MADKELRLRVGASIDASVATVFRSVVDAAKRAQTQVSQAQAQGNRQRVTANKNAAKETEKVFNSEATAAKKMADMMAKDVAKSAKERVKLEKEAMREIERDLLRHNRERARQAKDEAREEARLMKETARAQAKDARQRSKTGEFMGIQYNRHPIKNDALLLRGASAAYHAGSRFVGDAMHGMGVDTSLQGQLSGAVHREKLAAQISTGAYIKGHGDYQGPEGSNVQVDPKAIEKKAMDVANATGNTTENILEGVDKFVQATGDLKTIQDSMEDIGRVAKANGTDFEEMAMVAKDISLSMGDVKDKGPAIAAVMRTIAGQGHMGSVTMREQGKNMATLAAQANFFKIDPRYAKTLEGVGVNQDTTQRIAMLGAMQQLSRSLGGRATGKMASQGAMAFVRDLTSANEIKRMKAAGISTTNADNTARDPMQMILEVFRVASKGGTATGNLDMAVIKNLLPNKQSQAFAQAMSQGYNAAYNNTGGTNKERHAAAEQAIVKQFESFLTVTQGADEIAQKFATHLATADSQANIMNNRFGEAADALKTSLLPAIPPLTAALVAATGAATSFFDVLTGNGADKDRKIGFGASEGGQQAQITAQRALNGEVVSDKEIKAAEEAQVELDKQVAAKQKAVDSDHTGLAVAAVTAAGILLPFLDQVIGRAAGEGGAGAADPMVAAMNDNKEAQKVELIKMKAQQEKTTLTLENLHQKMATALSSTVLKVLITGDETKGGASPHTDGVTGGDSDLTSHEP